MKKLYLLFIIIMVFVISSIQHFSLQKSYKEKKENNIEVKSLLEKISHESILFSERELFYNSNSTNTNSSKRIPLEYDLANFDIDLMPIIISDKIIIAQTHSIKIFSHDFVYEYRCNEQIKSITYPKDEKSNLVFYVIKFNSSNTVKKVPYNERIWLLQEIIFIEDKFQEKTIAYIEIPSDYAVEQLTSEVCFFTYEENIINIVLTDANRKSSIFQITDNGRCLTKKNDGYIIIPNQFSNKFLWYLRKDDQNKVWLMKNEQMICEINQFISQGRFITESVIQFFYWDSSEFGKFDFVNGKYGAIYYSDLFIITENKVIKSYYEKIAKKNLFVKDKNKHNILIIF